jgi:hypothetical protein
MRVCVIDPGIRNFALGIEEFSVTAMESSNSLVDVCSNGKVIMLELTDLAKDHNATKVSHFILNNLTLYLESILDLLSTCDAFIIEKQLKLNPSAQWIEHHCYSFFISQFQSFRCIASFPPKIKYSEFNYSGSRKSKDRKKWAAIKAIDILSMRGEHDIKKLIQYSKKNDDLGDVIIMTQAFKSRVFIKKSFPETF